MKRLFIAVLLTLLLAAALAAAIAYDPGYVLIAFGRYTLETTFWVGVAALLALLLIMYVAVVVLHRSARQGSVFSRWRSNRKMQRGRQLTTRGILALVEGSFERARRLLDRAAVRSEMPAVNYLLAARASAALGDAKQTQLYLLRAEGSGARPGVAADLIQAQLQLRNGQLEQSLASLTRARQSAPKNPYVLELLKDAYTGLGDWQGLLGLIPELRRQRVVPGAELASLEINACVQLLGAAGRQGLVDTVRARWRELPKSATRSAPVLASYARALGAAGAGADAERLLRTQIKREWSRDLIEAYGLVKGADGALQLQNAQFWLVNRERDAALLLCLGRLSQRQSQWGIAREYLENSVKIEDNRDTCIELGRLLARLGQHERSAAYYERGLADQALLSRASPSTAVLRIV